MKRPTRKEAKAKKAKARRKRQHSGSSFLFACGRCGQSANVPAGNYGGRAICPACAEWMETDERPMP